MALGGGVEPVDRVGGHLHRGREPDARVGARQVVVDRLRDADHRHALGRHVGGGAHRPLAADRDQGVDAEVRERPADPFDALLMVRVRAGGSEDRSAAVQDPLDGRRGELEDVPVHDAAPTLSEPEDLEPVYADRRSHDRADRRVQAGRVSAGREDADACSHSSRSCPVAPGQVLWSGCREPGLYGPGQPTWSRGHARCLSDLDLRGLARRLGGGLARERARPGAVRPRPSGSPAGPAADRPARAAPPDDRTLRGPRTPRGPRVDRGRRRRALRRRRDRYLRSRRGRPGGPRSSRVPVRRRRGGRGAARRRLVRRRRDDLRIHGADDHAPQRRPARLVGCPGGRRGQAGRGAGPPIVARTRARRAPQTHDAHAGHGGRGDRSGARGRDRRRRAAGAAGPGRGGGRADGDVGHHRVPRGPEPVLALLGPTGGRTCETPEGLAPTGEVFEGYASWYGWEFGVSRLRPGRPSTRGCSRRRTAGCRSARSCGCATGTAAPSSS